VILHLAATQSLQHALGAAAPPMWQCGLVVMLLAGLATQVCVCVCVCVCARARASCMYACVYVWMCVCVAHLGAGPSIRHAAPDPMHTRTHGCTHAHTHTHMHARTHAHNTRMRAR
jgi:hypothetical protein